MSSEDLCCQAQIQHGRIANQQEEAPYFFWKKNLQLLRGSRNHANGGNRTSLHKAPKTARGVNLQIYLEKERMVPLPSSPTRNPPWMRRSTFKSEHKFCINFTNP